MDTTSTENPASVRLAQERSFSRREGAADRRARERVEKLLDPGSFLEIGLLARDRKHGRADKSPADGIIAGFGTVGRHRVGVISHDGAVLAGSGGHSGAAKQHRIYEEATLCGFPVVTMGEGGGGRVPDMMGSTFGQHGAMAKRTQLLYLARHDRPFTSIGVCLGEMYGDPSFKLGMSDFTLMTANASFGVSGPGVVKAGLGETVTGRELGGPDIHERNGQVMRVEATEEELLANVRRIITLTEDQHERSTDPDERPTPEVGELLPASHSRAYNVAKIVDVVADRDTPILPLWPNYGGSVFTCMARMGGRTVMIFASNPRIRAGVLDVESCRKSTKLVNQASRLGIPIVFLQDVPGFIVGAAAERQGILGEAMEYVRALVSAKVPKICIVMRKSYGLAYMAMAGPGWGGDYVAALSTARIAFMGPEPGINLVYAKKLDGVEDPSERQSMTDELIAEWSERAEPWEAAYDACIDDVIEPAEVRSTIIRALRSLERTSSPRA